MSSHIQVSIIICTYNPDLRKLLTSVKSVVVQTGVAFEIIVTDDGSKIDYFNDVKAYFEDIRFTEYSFIKNIDNLGTVKNVLNALKQARGEYVFLNSPGDYVFDSTVISDFYEFAKKNNADICFGDYIPYYLEEDEIKTSDFSRPRNVDVYSYKLNDYKALLLTGDDIVGASYFRSKKFALESMEYIEKYSKYVEDGTSTSYGLANSISIYYLNRNIVWYEYGTGISTNQNNKWSEIIRRDFINTYEALITDFPHDRFLKAALFYKTQTDQRFWQINFFIHHPIIFIKKLRFKKMKERKLLANNMEKNALLKLIKSTEDDIACQQS